MLDGLIVLGLVPGTQLQITFNTWLIILCGVVWFLVVWRSYRTAALQKLIITSGIIAITHRPMRMQQLSV